MQELNPTLLQFPCKNLAATVIASNNTLLQFRQEYLCKIFQDTVMFVNHTY